MILMVANDRKQDDCNAQMAGNGGRRTGASLVVGHLQDEGSCATCCARCTRQWLPGENSSNVDTNSQGQRTIGGEMTELEYQKLRLILDEFSFFIDADDPKKVELLGHRKSMELESRIERLEKRPRAERSGADVSF